MFWFRLSAFVFLASAQMAFGVTDVYFFHAKGCPHCEDAQRDLGPFFARHPEVRVHKYEVRGNRANRQKLLQFAKAYGRTINSVPAIFIGDEVFVGFSDRTRKKIEAKVRACQTNGCPSRL